MLESLILAFIQHAKYVFVILSSPLFLMSIEDSLKAICLMDSCHFHFALHGIVMI